MKNVFLLPAICLFMLGAEAKTNALFNIDEAQIEAEFSALTALESRLAINTNITFLDLQQNSDEALGTVNFNGENPLAISKYGQYGGGGGRFSSMDWGAFAWGFICCPVGLFTVALNGNKDQNAKKSYWTGVIISTILSIISTAAGAL